MPTVDLRIDGVEPGVVGVVDVLDEQLITVKTVVLGMGQGTVDLPAGRYVARGRLSSGELVRTSFVAGDDPVLAALRPDEPVAGPVARVAQASMWQYVRSTWVPEGKAFPITATTTYLTTRPDDGRCRAIQIDDGEVSVIAVLPAGTVVGVEWLEKTGWRVRPRSGLATALLDYLHHGDLDSAHVIADALSAVFADSPLSDLVVAYHRVLTGDELTGHSVVRLRYSQPDSVSGAVLRATLARALPNVDPEVITGELLAAARGGLPVLRGVLELLVEGLRAAGTDDAVAEAARLRRYLGSAGISSPFTTFAGYWPGDPGGSEAPVDVTTGGRTPLRRGR